MFVFVSFPGHLQAHAVAASIFVQLCRIVVCLACLLALLQQHLRSPLQLLFSFLHIVFGDRPDRPTDRRRTELVPRPCVAAALLWPILPSSRVVRLDEFFLSWYFLPSFFWRSLFSGSEHCWTHTRIHCAATMVWKRSKDKTLLTLFFNS